MNNCNFYTWKEFQASLGVTAQICLLKTKHTNQLKKNKWNKRKRLPVTFSRWISLIFIHVCTQREYVIYVWLEYMLWLCICYVYRKEFLFFDNFTHMCPEFGWCSALSSCHSLLWNLSSHIPLLFQLFCLVFPWVVCMNRDRALIQWNMATSHRLHHWKT